MPQSARELARAARKRGVKPSVPEEGKSWIQERDERDALDMRASMMETAKMLLAVYCRKMSIDDAECQRIADRINYERSEKNHLRNAKPLRSQAEVIAAALTKLGKSKSQNIIENEMEKLLGRKRLPVMKI